MQLWPLCQHWHPSGGLQVCLHCMDLLTLLHFGGVQNLVAQTYAMHGFMYVACTPELWAPSCMHSRLTLSHIRLAHASKDNDLVMLSISSSRSSSKLLCKMTRRTLQASIVLSSAISASTFDYVTCFVASSCMLCRHFRGDVWMADAECPLSHVSRCACDDQNAVAGSCSAACDSRERLAFVMRSFRRGSQAG